MTKLLYLDDFNVTSCTAKVTAVSQHEGKDVLELDQTCFYPKGGGQDFDTGVIEDANANVFNVEAAFFVDGVVKHIGSFAGGKFGYDDSVQCNVDETRRDINTMIHSAGHVIDMAIRSIGYEWHPGKGAHYPDMAFVEYSGEYDGENKDNYVSEIQTAVDSLLTSGSTNRIAFMDADEMKNHGAVVPENIPKDKPSRVMMYDDFAVPCGGTHVQNISDTGTIRVTKIKKKGGEIRVSYSVG